MNNMKYKKEEKEKQKDGKQWFIFTEQSNTHNNLHLNSKNR